ncbi:MAG: type VI secretion protein, partial [Erythrobacter sp.]
MRLAMRLPPKNGGSGAANDGDPREGESAEVIDLASRSAFPAVTERKSKSEGLGLAAGVAIVGLLGAVTFWAMNAAQIEEPAPTVGSAGPQPTQAAT